MNSVLIVDDSRTFQQVIKEILSEKFEIIGRGRSGIEGFDLYSQLKPDLVILDITMPICSGKECLEKILKFDSTANVIMVSGINDEITIKECMNLGAKGYVNKESILNAENKISPLLKTAQEVMEMSLRKRAANE